MSEDEGISVNEWDAYASDWDQDEVACAYAEAAFASLQERIRGRLPLAGAKVIDFGCGTGLLTEQLVAEGATVLGVDSSPAMLAVFDAKVDQLNWQNVETSFHLPTPAADRDLVVCSSVCSFLDDYPGTVAALVASLRPGGLFVQWDWERTNEDQHGLSKAEINEALIAAGLEEISVSQGFTATGGEQVMRPLMGLGWAPET